MSFLIRSINGRFTPLATCDSCGEWLTEPRNAVTVFDMQAGGDAVPRLACKGKCHRSMDAEIEEAGGHPGWNELGRWMADLLYNVGLHGKELDDAVESSKTMNEMGI